MARILIFLFFLPFSFQEEQAAGVFIVNTPPKRTVCDNELKTVIGQVKICISKKPIVAIEEIDYVTEIRYEPKIEAHYIDIGFSSLAVSTLTRTAASLPSAKFALVVDGDVICLFSLSSQMGLRYVRIGEDAPLKDLTVIHDILRNTKF